MAGCDGGGGLVVVMVLNCRARTSHATRKELLGEQQFKNAFRVFSECLKSGAVSLSSAGPALTSY